MTRRPFGTASTNCAANSRCRAWPTPRAATQEADWLVGINGTRAMTAFNSRDGGFFLTTVGRVHADAFQWWSSAKKIRKFVSSRDYWEVHGSFLAAGEYPGKWFNPDWKKPPPGPDGDARP